MGYYTTEITSDEIASDNPIHQRLFSPYAYAKNIVNGDLLEIGCGFGRGVEVLTQACDNYTGIDKIEGLVKELQSKFPKAKFIATNIPPLHNIKDNSFDWIVSFQVIEHIKDDHAYLKEIQRVLKPGGKAIITTPNKKFTLTRNPWHIREYTVEELSTLCNKYFSHVQLQGVLGSDKVMDYHEKNRKSVKKITRWDILNLQYNLPRWMIRIPYDIFNRVNRKKLLKEEGGLVSDITWEDFTISDEPEKCLDHFFTLTK